MHVFLASGLIIVVILLLLSSSFIITIVIIITPHYHQEGGLQPHSSASPCSFNLYTCFSCRIKWRCVYVCVCVCVRARARACLSVCPSTLCVRADGNRGNRQIHSSVSNLELTGIQPVGSDSLGFPPKQTNKQTKKHTALSSGTTHASSFRWV